MIHSILPSYLPIFIQCDLTFLQMKRLAEFFSLLTVIVISYIELPMLNVLIILVFVKLFLKMHTGWVQWWTQVQPRVTWRECPRSFPAL